MPKGLDIDMAQALRSDVIGSCEPKRPGFKKAASLRRYCYAAQSLTGRTSLAYSQH